MTVRQITGFINALVLIYYTGPCVVDTAHKPFFFNLHNQL